MDNTAKIWTYGNHPKKEKSRQLFDRLKEPDMEEDLEECLVLDYLPLTSFNNIYVLVSKKKGIILIGDQQDILEAYGELYSRFTVYHEFQNIKNNKSELIFNIYIVKFIDIDSAISEIKGLDDQSSVSRWPRRYQLLCSVVQGLQPRVAKIDLSQEQENDHVAIIEKVHNQIRRFDPIQEESVFDAPFSNRVLKIQGIAGSGKTLILAYKILDFHLRHPDKIVIYTYYNRKLQSHIRNLMVEIANNVKARQIDWKKIFILHAWGSKNLLGFYSLMCNYYSVPALPLKIDRYNSRHFDQVCKALTDAIPEKIPPDVSLIVVDEAQDFMDCPHFFKLCDIILSKKDEGRIIVAGDIFQNIFSTTQDRKLFEYINEVFSDTTAPISLTKSYRTPRDILLMAHAFGLGLYRNNIISILPDADAWKSIGYQVEPDNYKVGEQVVLRRDTIEGFDEIPIGSALILKNLCFSTIEEECTNIISLIDYFISLNVRADEICIILPTYIPSLYEKYSSLFSQHLKIYDTRAAEHSRAFTYGEYKTNDIVGKVEDLITFTSMNHIKGQEFDIVFVVGIREPLFDIQRWRSRVFTAMTRPRSFLGLSGAGNQNIELQREIDNIIGSIQKNNSIFFTHTATIPRTVIDRPRKNPNSVAIKELRSKIKMLSKKSEESSASEYYEISKEIAALKESLERLVEGSEN